MLSIIKKWVSRYFANEEILILFGLLILLGLGFVYLDEVLVPVLTSVILAFLMQGAVERLVKLRVPNLLAVILVVLSFSVFVLLAFVLFLPALWDQFENFLGELPKMINNMQQWLLVLPERYPEWVTHAQVNEVIGLIQQKIADLGKGALSFSFSTISNLFVLVVYIFLVPMLVFFFLKDKELILSWFAKFFPDERPLMNTLTSEMNQQISNYIRGKSIEIVVVGVACFLLLTLLDLRYAILLSVLTGLSVLVPFIGAAAVGLLVTAIALFQFGVSSSFFYVFFGYGILQVLDGNVLVPLLFSEVVNLHPVAIIVAVLAFGAVWGVWGVFFAIPLATFIKALLNAWPGRVDTEPEAEAV